MSRNNEAYPTDLTLIGDVGDGVPISTDDLIAIAMNGHGAIKIRIEINSPNYPKELVQLSVREICQRVTEFY